MPAPIDSDLLVGFETHDDAAVYRVSNEIAVISTVDFITPPVDDPIWFGRIAAANSLSDVYAMGGRPITALSLVMFPSKILGTDTLREILKGGHEKVSEAGASLAGGHSVDDLEPKYGLAVTGVVSPHGVLTNTGVRPGDALILTKPIGSGVLFNACRSGKLPRQDLQDILPHIAALNRSALEVALNFEIHACTDITGFGLLGHTLEMATGSGLRIDLSFNEIPIYPHALAMYQKGETTGSNKANRKLVQERLELGIKLRTEQLELLFDPQTSGGLLLAVPSNQSDSMVEQLRKAGVKESICIGEAFEEGRPGLRLV